jgi:murein DD-endopeptidase MepM/ murein hydrolase activator NlpD
MGRVLLWMGLLWATAADARGRVYVVKPGDTLNEIAKANGCTVDDLKKSNRLRSDFLKDGAELKLPRGCTKAKTVGKAAAKNDQAAKGSKNDKSKSDTAGKNDKADAVAKKKPRRKPVLREVLAEHGFAGRYGLKARVVEITLDKKLRRITKEAIYDWDQTAYEHQDWNAASTIKLFSAIGALERIKTKGFDSRAEVTFFGQGTSTHKVADLVADSLIKSDNIAHNRLTQLAGYDYLNGQVLSRRGLKHSAIHRPYETSRWLPMTGARTFRETPRIALKQGKKTRTLPAEVGTGGYPCVHNAACSSMADLAAAMRRLMLHEQLPKAQRFNLDRTELRVIRDALKAERKRGMDVVDQIEKAFPPGRIVAFHKPGFSEGWISDVVYLYDHKSQKRWLVAMAAPGGRQALNGAAAAVGKALAAGDLTY